MLNITSYENHRKIGAKILPQLHTIPQYTIIFFIFKKNEIPFALFI